MSFTHWRLTVAGEIKILPDERIDADLSELLQEHRISQPSIEERCARAEAIAIFLVEKVRRLEQTPSKQE